MSQELRFPSIDGLRAFESTARLGSFERAAEELAITASAVAKRVATVEALLGTVLFTRGARGLRLNPTGEDYLHQVRGALQLLSAMPLHRRQAQRRERLRLRAPPTFARQVLVPQLPDFAEAHAEVELELQLSLPHDSAAGSPVDVEVRYAELPADAASALLAEPVWPLAAPGWLAQQPPLHQAADLLQLPLLRTPLQPWQPWFRAAGLDAPEPTQGPKLLDLGLTLEAAVAGQGVALARPSLAQAWLAAGSLRPAWPLQAWPSHHYQWQRHADSAGAAAFVAWLQACCAQLQARAQDELSRQLRTFFGAPPQRPR